MARWLLDSGEVELGIIAHEAVKQFTECDYRQVKQWLVPGGTQLGRDGMPPASLVQAIVAAVKEFSPDLVHIWGVESFWGLLPARGLLTYPLLLRMQGLKGEYAKVYYGGLTFPERLRSIGIKELLKRRTMHSARKDFVRWGSFEQEIIRGHRFVEAESDWIAAQVRAVNPDVRVFSIDPVLRDPFYEAEGWQGATQPTIFCTAAYPVPYKGLHVAIRALKVLRKWIPNARLRIAGKHQLPGIRQEGYMRWINRMIRQLGLTDAIEWLGPLNAEQIVAEMKNAAATVIPTFIENSCAAMQEAMTFGSPVVVSYVGGLPSLGKDAESCLFFPPGDEVMCARQLERVLTDRNLALRLSRESRKIAAVRNDHRRIVGQQLEIYRQVVEASR
jgi:glycosyltransferase involved in cell wall biosynthesis